MFIISRSIYTDQVTVASSISYTQVKRKKYPIIHSNLLKWYDCTTFHGGSEVKALKQTHFRIYTFYNIGQEVIDEDDVYDM